MKGEIMRIATLCGMGFGTSMMLKLSWDLGTFKGQQADIVVAPTDMEMHLKSANARVVLIRNLVDKKEIKEKVLKAIEDYQNK
jgi:PTS system ascorbate-specific IIB component